MCLDVLKDVLGWRELLGSVGLQVDNGAVR